MFKYLWDSSQLLLCLLSFRKGAADNISQRFDRTSAESPGVKEKSARPHASHSPLSIPRPRGIKIHFLPPMLYSIVNTWMLSSAENAKQRKSSVRIQRMRNQPLPKCCFVEVRLRSCNMQSSRNSLSYKGINARSYWQMEMRGTTDRQLKRSRPFLTPRAAFSPFCVMWLNN